MGPQRDETRNKKGEVYETVRIMTRDQWWTRVAEGMVTKIKLIALSESV